MKKLLMMVALILAFPSTASADMTGKDLKGLCRQHPQASEDTSLCTGYIWGSVDTARALKVACEPPGVLGSRLIDMTIKYLLVHSERLQLSASSLIVEMYKKEFPCPRNPG